MRYKHIFWDWNGTLIDDVGNALMCVNDMLTRKNRSAITMEQYYTYIETPIIGFYRHILPPEELKFDEIAKDYHSDYYRHLPETSLANGAIELLSDIRASGAKQYIVTANHLDESLELTKQYGVAEYFEAVLGAENNLAESKAERAKAFFKERGIRPEEAIFIGDSLHDRETADFLGIPAILVTYGHQGKKILKESGSSVFDNLYEIREALFDDRTVDLHTHSSMSDGTLPPRELVFYAKEKGLSAIALTDHDTVDGIEPAIFAAKEAGIELIPGIELSCAFDTELHILGLGIDYKSPALLNTIYRLRENRRERMKDILNRLNALDMPLSEAEVAAFSKSGFIGRAHIARAMVSKGYSASVKEAFAEYLSIGRPAYSPKKDLSPDDAINAIHEAGGKAVLAHLNQTKYNYEQLDTLLNTLRASGLDGIEGYYTEYTPEIVSEYRALALKHGLRLSGGSDFHAEMKPHIEIGVGTGNLCIPYHILKSLFSE